MTLVDWVDGAQQVKWMYMKNQSIKWLRQRLWFVIKRNSDRHYATAFSTAQYSNRHRANKSRSAAIYVCCWLKPKHKKEPNKTSRVKANSFGSTITLSMSFYFDIAQYVVTVDFKCAQLVNVESQIINWERRNECKRFHQRKRLTVCEN